MRSTRAFFPRHFPTASRLVVRWALAGKLSLHDGSGEMFRWIRSIHAVNTSGDPESDENRNKPHGRWLGAPGSGGMNLPLVFVLCCIPPHLCAVVRPSRKSNERDSKPFTNFPK